MKTKPYMLFAISVILVYAVSVTIALSFTSRPSVVLFRAVEVKKQLFFGAFRQRFHWFINGSKIMIDAAEEYFALRPNFAQDFPNFNIRGLIPAPYLFWYQYRGLDTLRGLSPHNASLMGVVTTWIEHNYEQKYKLVGSQRDRGVITQETVPFPFKPGEVIVWENKREVHAAIARSWTLEKHDLFQVKKERDWLKNSINSETSTKKWTVDTWKYEYDGRFFREEQSIEIVLGYHN